MSVTKQVCFPPATSPQGQRPFDWQICKAARWLMLLSLMQVS